MLAELRDLTTIVRTSQAVPAQVLLSTPVVLLDACGRCAPFHLEFIDSSEVRALICMGEIRLHRSNTSITGFYSSAKSPLQGRRPAQNRARPVRPRRYSAEKEPKPFRLLEHNFQAWTTHIYEYDFPILGGSSY